MFPLQLRPRPAARARRDLAAPSAVAELSARWRRSGAPSMRIRSSGPPPHCAIAVAAVAYWADLGGPQRARRSGSPRSEWPGPPSRSGAWCVLRLPARPAVPLILAGGLVLHWPRPAVAAAQQRRPVPLRLGRPGPGGRDRPVPVRPGRARAGRPARPHPLAGHGRTGACRPARPIRRPATRSPRLHPDQPAGGAHHLPAGGRGRVRRPCTRSGPALPARTSARRPARPGHHAAAPDRPAPARPGSAAGRAVGLVPDRRPGGRQQRPHRRRSPRC